MKMKVSVLRALGILALTLATPAMAQDQAACKFDFTGGTPSAGWIHVSPSDVYSAQTGYGFEPGADLALRTPSNFSITSKHPFYFSVKVPEGNYKVTITLDEDSVTTVKAELRRLMLQHVRIPKGQPAVRSFIVNVRTPRISADNAVHLKTRETTSEIWDWDDKLTLEFNDTAPCLAKLELEKVDVPTVFLLGDSTVCDQPAEPWNSWGQMLPRFFRPDVAVANHAESGETLAGALHAQRVEKIFSAMKPGDYLLVQFGHNDMKSKSAAALETYKANLKQVVARTRERGGTPVLVTSMERKAGVDHDTLAGYPETVRTVAQEDHCALIDLHALSRVFYKALGPDLDKAFQDGTHHNNYGSYELAKCIVAGIQQAKLPLAKSIGDDWTAFDPAQPDPVAAFAMPASPVVSTAKPLGS